MNPDESVVQLRAYASNLEDVITQRDAELTATNHQLESLVYSIAHDLRAPLRAMQGYSAMLIEESSLGLNAAGADYAQRIGKAALHMDSLLSDLLQFSRISRLSVILAVTNLPGIIARVIEGLRPEIAAQRGEVATLTIWPEVMAHEPTLVQVISNLVSNALKFVQGGRSPVITLRTEERGPFVRLWIEDNGLGIPLDYQEQIFRLFTRLNGETFAGTGIGLAIVQKGVERLGGRVGLESVLGEGSRFWVELRKVAAIDPPALLP